MTRKNLEDSKAEGTTISQADDGRTTPTMLQPSPASMDDIDNSERSAREKLKKASLGSLGEASEHDGLENSDGPSLTSLPTSGLTQESTRTLATLETNRGRPQRKRSYEDFEKAGNETEIAAEGQPEYASSHSRKRSRDIQSKGPTSSQQDSQPYGTDYANEEFKDEAAYSPSHISYKSALGDKLEISPSPLASREPDGHDNHGAASSVSDGDAKLEDLKPDNTAKSDTLDQEMEGGALSPRRKRSRDQFDTEVDRELKIAATEEARALRLSSEMDRDEMITGSAKTPLASATPEATGGLKPEPSKNVFGSTSRLAAPTTHPSTASSLKSLEEKVTSQSSFASSGFAALANSAASPFGSIGAPAKSKIASYSTAKFDPNEIASGIAETPEIGVTDRAGFDPLEEHRIPSTRPREPPPFTVAGSIKPSIFGSSVFGAGFGRGNSTGNKLTSFARLSGDTKPGSNNGNIKPIVPSDNPNENDQSSESQEDGEEEAGKDDKANETDERFQQQDGMLVSI